MNQIIVFEILNPHLPYILQHFLYILIQFIYKWNGRSNPTIYLPLVKVIPLRRILNSSLKNNESVHELVNGKSTKINELCPKVFGSNQMEKAHQYKKN